MMNAGLARASRALVRHLAWSLSAVSLLACTAGGGSKNAAPDTSAPASTAASAPRSGPRINPGPVSIKESFVARREATARLQSLSLAQPLLGPPWLYTADTSTDELVMFDASSGRFIEKFGKRGAGKGEFSGISDVTVIDRMLYITETGNRRVQVLYLPKLPTLAQIGPEGLNAPRAVQARVLGGGHFMVYVVDTEGEQLVLRLFDLSVQAPPSPPGTDPIFSLDVATVTSEHKHLRDIALGLPATAEVELALDIENDRLLVASGKVLKSLKLDGSPRDADLTLPSVTGTLGGLGLFACPQQPAKGYWIVGDRSADAQAFQVIDRISFEPVTRFTGQQTQNASTLAFAQQPMAYFPFGAVYAIHQDSAVASFSWQTLAAETGVRRICL